MDLNTIKEVAHPRTRDQLPVWTAGDAWLAGGTWLFSEPQAHLTRLIDLKIPAFLITSTVIGILAQRLVRVICAHCSEEYDASLEEAIALGVPFEELANRKLKRLK